MMTLEQRVERLCRNRGVTPPFRLAILQAFQAVREEALVQVMEVAHDLMPADGVDQMAFELQADVPLADEG